MASIIITRAQFNKTCADSTSQLTMLVTQFFIKAQFIVYNLSHYALIFLIVPPNANCIVKCLHI